MMFYMYFCICFFFSSRRRHTRYIGDWSSDVCSSDLHLPEFGWNPIVLTVRPEFYQEKPDWDLMPLLAPGLEVIRSEERRVGKEWRDRGAQDRLKKKKEG